MIPEYSLWKFSGEVYRIDSKNKDYDPKLKEGRFRGFSGIEYKILKVEDNTVNGMQAMAVAPVKDGKVDTSEIVIAYAGTNLNDKLDRATDIQTVVFGNKDTLDDVYISVESQIVFAEKFADVIE